MHIDAVCCPANLFNKGTPFDSRGRVERVALRKRGSRAVRTLAFILIIAVMLTNISSLFTLALTYYDWNYTILSDTEVEINEYMGDLRDVTVPATIEGRKVTSIGDNAFSGLRWLKSVTIQEGVEEIGNNAFFNNTSLTRVTLPNTLARINYSAFYNCKKLTHILIPVNVAYIGYEAFGACSRLMTVYFMSANDTSISEPPEPPLAEGNAFVGLPAGARAVIPNSMAHLYPVNYDPESGTGTWNNLIVKTEQEFGIDYSSVNETFLKANGLDGNQKDGFEINLSQETLNVPIGYTIRSYSLDGGNKWRRARPEMFNKVKFPKFLDKGMTLYLSDSEINPVTKQPYDNLNTVVFPLINRRPQAPRFRINYELSADATGATSGKWVLSLPSVTRDRSTETEYKGNIEIGLSMGAKIADDRGYGKMPEGGIPIFTYREFGNRVKKTSYLVRIPPQTAAEAGIAGLTYTPASKTVRFNVSSEQKPPKYKVNQKKQIIKLAGNDGVFHGTERYLTDPINAPIPTPGSIPSSANLINLPEHQSWYNPVKTRVEVSTAGFASDLTIWKAATVNKPASGKQVLLTKPIEPPVERIAKFASRAVISGRLGGNSLDNDQPNELTIEVTSDGFNTLTANDDLSAWFDGSDELPSGLTAVVKEDVAEGATSVTVLFGGNMPPDVPDEFRIDMIIPASAMQSGEDLTITQGPYYPTSIWRIWNAEAEPPNNKPFYTGRVGSQVSIDEDSGLPTTKQLGIRITGDRLRDEVYSESEALWMENPPAGLDVSMYASGSMLTYNFSGTPTEATKENVKIRIPGSYLDSRQDLVIDIPDIMFYVKDIDEP
jgi:hypothetical protein